MKNMTFLIKKRDLLNGQKKTPPHEQKLPFRAKHKKPPPHGGG